MKLMKFGTFLNVPVFIISLAIGLFFVYISAPSPNVIFIYPNPDNEAQLLFKDKSETCYRCKSKEIRCPKDASKIVSYPIQTYQPELKKQPELK